MVESPSPAVAILTTEGSATGSIGSHTEVVPLPVDDSISVLDGGSVEAASSPNAGHAHELTPRSP